VDLEPLEGRIARLEEHAAIAPAPREEHAAATFEEFTGAIEQRLREQASRFEYLLNQLDQRVTAEMHAANRHDPQVSSSLQQEQAHIEEQIRSLRRTLGAEAEVLREEIAALHRRLTYTVGKEVDERLLATESALEARIAARMEPLSQQMGETLRMAEENRRQTAELVERVERSGRGVLQAIAAMGQVCLDAAQELSPNPPAEPIAAPTPAEEITEADPSSDATTPVEVERAVAATAGASDVPLRVPAFTQATPENNSWPVLMVSSVLLATTGFSAILYLYL
jgi:hypothetical protein